MYNQRESQYRPGTSRTDYERQRLGRDRGYDPQQAGRATGAGVYDMDEEDFGQERDDYRGGVSSSETRRYGRGANSEGYAGRGQDNFGQQGEYRSRMTTGGTSNWDDSNWGDRGFGSQMGRGGYQSHDRGNFDQQGNPQQPGNSGWNLGGYASPRGGSGFGQQEQQGQRGSMGSNWGVGRQQSTWQNRSQGQHVGRGPKGYRRSDERITEDVNEALSQHPDLDASEIEVKVQNGEVTLTGSVTERQDKRIAEDVVEQCPGVKDVRNELRVQPRSMSSSSGSQHPEGEPQHQGINAGSTIGVSGSRIAPEKK